MTRRSDASRRRKNGGGSATPWLIGGGVFLVVAGAVVAIVLSRSPKEPVAGKDGDTDPKGGPVLGSGEPGPGGKPKPDGGIPGIIPKAGGDPLFTRQKVDRIQDGMKKEDVAAIFGPGRAATEQEALNAHVAATQQDGEQRFAKSRALGVRAWEKWLDGGDSLFVGYGPTSRGDRIAYHIWFHAGPAGGSIRPGGIFQASDLESAAQRWDREQAILKDPKWKTGAEARAALVGKWLNSSNAGYEFLADGTHKWLGTGPYTSTYRFRDPQTLELDSFDPFAKMKGLTIPYRVLVAGGEMYLVHQPDATRPLPVGPYARQPAGMK